MSLPPTAALLVRELFAHHHKALLGFQFHSLNRNSLTE